MRLCDVRELAVKIRADPAGGPVGGRRVQGPCMSFPSRLTGEGLCIRDKASFIRKLQSESAVASLEVHHDTPHFAVHEPLGERRIVALQNGIEEAEEPGLWVSSHGSGPLFVASSLKL